MFLPCIIKGLRVEWAKSYARAERWEEEVSLVQEEMRRVLAFLNDKARWWREQSCLRTNVDDATLSGIRAYAEKQAELRHALGIDFACEWREVYAECGLEPPTHWPSYFLTAAPGQKRIQRRPERRKLRQRTFAVLAERPVSPCP